MEQSIYSSIISVIEIVCSMLFIYQFVYLVVALFTKSPRFKAKKQYRYAIMISAKNEENVIGNLIKSIMAQDYPKELFKVFVVADNCDDNTAQVSRDAGAIVYERTNKKRKGKGYALRFLIQQIHRDFNLKSFDGYMVFDADNLLDKSYITEINKVFSNGYKICTSYRNSKNYGSNWVTASSGIWFLREARHLNHARMALGVSCMVSGTGYVMHRDIVVRNDGWKFFLLTEDVEFSVDSIIKGETIGYCESAVFYDEQPTSFVDSFNQRLRWAKGFYQVLHKNCKDLFKGLFSKRFMTYFDALVTLGPGYIFLGGCVSVAILTVLDNGGNFIGFTNAIIGLVLPLLLTSYILFIAIGFFVLITEYKKIYCKPSRAFLLLLTFPAFMFTYIPIAVMALFAKVKWKPIRHTFSYDNEKMQSQR